MAIRTILTQGDPALSKVCHPVTKFDDRLGVLLDDLKETLGLAGCLSVPGMWGDGTRPQWVKVKAQDRNGAWFETEGTGLTARCFCHEISHLDGHLYTELADRLYTTEELDRMAEEQEDAGEEDQ